MSIPAQLDELERTVDRNTQALFGIPGTDEHGMLGELRELRRRIDQLLGTVAIGSLSIVTTILATHFIH